MSSFSVSNLISDERRPPKNGEPAVGLVRIPTVDQGGEPSNAFSGCDSFSAGIRALDGQLTSCESPAGKRIRTIGVTSCYDGEGKSTVAAHFASLAAETRRVLLIDAAGSPVVVRRAMQDVVRAGGASGQALGIPAMRPQPSNGDRSTTSLPEKPAPAPTKELLTLLAVKFDLIVVDLPRVDAAEVYEWAPLLDGVVLIVEAECVRWQVAARGIALLRQTGTQVLGTIINKRRDYIPSWLYQLI
jgi:Mrp family chromosome partitioning ATPase